MKDNVSKININFLNSIISIIIIDIAIFFINTKKSMHDKFIMKIILNETIIITFLCRLHEKAAIEYYNYLATSYQLFVKDDFKHELMLILDKENILDHQAALILSKLPPYPKVLFENYYDNTFCKFWRNEGYSRQQFSLFISDLYIKTKYLGVLDSDTVFVHNVTMKYLFKNNKPRVYGYNGCCRGWNEATKYLDIPIIGEFMVNSGFPMIIKTQHISEIRNYIIKKLDKNNFSCAFKEICSKFKKNYSQFNIIYNYLFQYHRDEYEWHLRISPTHPNMKIYNNSIFFRKFNKPIIALTKHFCHENLKSIFSILADYFCYNNGIKECAFLQINEITKGVKANLYTDYLYETGYWKDRKMPSVYGGKWENGEKTWIKI